MENQSFYLQKLLDSLRQISWWDRVFGWRKIREQLFDANAAWQTARAAAERAEERNQALMDLRDRLENDAAMSTKSLEHLQYRKNEMDIEMAELKRDHQHLQAVFAQDQNLHRLLQQEEAFRKKEHGQAVASLAAVQQQILELRARETEERHAADMQRIRQLKDNWINHQANAKRQIQAIAQKHIIPYVDAVPFRGEPDNTLRICDEYIVLDAKSPANDDLRHFPVYLKDQAEKAKKYARQENVRTDIFFVVPSGTLETLSEFVYRHGDHTVFIISQDALEPVILGLKKIEEYEFAEQLSPEDRQQICRVLGRFAHLSKRRIQVDSFFARQFIELAYKCETNLPANVRTGMDEFERSEKLNPPQEKRAKSIPLPELERELRNIVQDAAGRGILPAADDLAMSLNALPLYTDPAAG